MSERTHKQRRHSGDTARETETVVEPPAGGSGGRLMAELDGLLDEIDDVLETNAEEFVKGYVQKGGE